MASAYVLLKCQSGSEDYVLSSLRSLILVRRAVGVLGTYDVVARLETNSEQGLRDAITKIRKMPRITGTYTLIVDDKDGFSRNVEGKEYLDRYLSQAYILVECDTNGEKEVVRGLEAIPEVLDANVLIYSHQVICNVVAPTFEDISGIVTKKIRKIPRIRGTVTLNVVGK